MVLIMKINDFLNCDVPFGVCDFPDEALLINCKNKSRLPENPKSVIMFAFPYLVETHNPNISKYAIVADYHTVLLNRLEQYARQLKSQLNGEFVAFVDNSPIPEIFCAKQSGLGFVGENRLLITTNFGSYVFLGSIVTDIYLEANEPNNNQCLNCQKCVLSCPGNALLDNLFNKNMCASNISQKKGDLTDFEKAILKKSGLVWGCDICQDVCPHNENVTLSNIDEFKNDVIENIHIDNIEPLIKTRAFGFRGVGVLKRNFDILK